MKRAFLAAVAALSLALAACSAGTGGDWPIPDLKGPLADCHALGDVCGGSGWCGATRDDVLVCCPVALEEDGIHCPGPGAPGVTECVVDDDCPREDCHEAPSCLGGLCFSRIARLPNSCFTGLCDGTGSCVPCSTDADCMAGISRSNGNECYDFTCMDSGMCAPVIKREGDACNFTSGGMCDAQAACR